MNDTILASTLLFKILDNISLSTVIIIFLLPVMDQYTSGLYY